MNLAVLAQMNNTMLASRGKLFSFSTSRHNSNFVFCGCASKLLEKLKSSIVFANIMLLFGQKDFPSIPKIIARVCPLHYKGKTASFDYC